MITRIAQRGPDDCGICAVAMVMGPPYSYERVLADSHSYLRISPDGKFLAWWDIYLRDEGFDTCLCHFDGLYAIPQYSGAVVALLGMDIPHLQRGHIVAVDELGVIDPADNAPNHVGLDFYVRSRTPDGVIFHEEFLAVRKALPSEKLHEVAIPPIPRLKSRN